MFYLGGTHQHKIYQHNFFDNQLIKANSSLA
jgi:hypothetical protein